MNAIHRRVAWELLCGLGSSHVHLEHELYRVAHRYRDGLTDKEYEFLVARCEVLKQETEKLVKLKERLQGTLDGKRK